MCLSLSLVFLHKYPTFRYRDYHYVQNAMAWWRQLKNAQADCSIF